VLTVLSQLTPLWAATAQNSFCFVFHLVKTFVFWFSSSRLGPVQRWASVACAHSTGGWMVQIWLLCWCTESCCSSECWRVCCAECRSILFSCWQLRHHSVECRSSSSSHRGNLADCLMAASVVMRSVVTQVSRAFTVSLVLGADFQRFLSQA